jgi:HSP20 family protein
VRPRYADVEGGAQDHGKEDVMAVMRWDPFAEVDRILDLVSSRGTSGGGETAARGMPMDVYRKDDTYVVEMDLPGIDPSTIDIRVERNLLTVEAEGKATHEQADEVLVCERRHVRYRRQLYLGDNVDSDNVDARYDDGVLRMQIPISKEDRSRKVEVSTGSRSKQIGNGADTSSEAAGQGAQSPG